LEVVQVMDMMEYMEKTRAEFLQLTGRRTDRLFTSTGSSDSFSNIMGYLVRRLRQINNRVQSAQQLKASVIVHWLKLYNLRQVQYLAGHRYVSSTEGFLVNEMEEMSGDIEKYHPIHDNQ
jgi:integrase/recombinase XerD